MIFWVLIIIGDVTALYVDDLWVIRVEICDTVEELNLSKCDRLNTLKLKG